MSIISSSWEREFLGISPNSRNWKLPIMKFPNTTHRRDQVLPGHRAKERGAGGGGVARDVGEEPGSEPARSDVHAAHARTQPSNRAAGRGGRRCSRCAVCSFRLTLSSRAVAKGQWRRCVVVAALPAGNGVVHGRRHAGSAACESSGDGRAARTQQWCQPQRSLRRHAQLWLPTAGAGGHGERPPLRHRLAAPPAELGLRRAGGRAGWSGLLPARLPAAMGAVVSGQVPAAPSVFVRSGIGHLAW